MASQLEGKLLLIHGTADRLTDVEASREFATAAGDHCTLRLFEGLYHEPHNEPEKADVFECVIDWIEGRAGLLGAGSR